MDLPLKYNKFQVNLKVKRNMKISELAQKTGVSASAIRFYEEQGLLEPAGRHRNGYRYYTDRALLQLHVVRVCQSLGFTLDTIRGFFSGDGGCDHGRVLEQIAIRTRSIKAEQAALQTQLAQLEKLQGFLENGAIPDSACTLPHSS